MCDVDTNTGAQNSIRVLIREIGQDQTCPLFFQHIHFLESIKTNQEKNQFKQNHILTEIWLCKLWDSGDFWNHIIARKISCRAPFSSKVYFVVLSLIPRHLLKLNPYYSQWNKNPLSTTTGGRKPVQYNFADFPAKQDKDKDKKWHLWAAPRALKRIVIDYAWYSNYLSQHYVSNTGNLINISGHLQFTVSFLVLNGQCFLVKTLCWVSQGNGQERYNTPPLPNCLAQINRNRNVRFGSI